MHRSSSTSRLERPFPERPLKNSDYGQHNQQRAKTSSPAILAGEGVLRCVLVALCFALTCSPAAARPWFCLPPVFDGGQRLHPLPAPQVFWLELLLRQHELCWRAPDQPGELRIVLGGSSGVYGYGLPAEETFGALLNQHFAAGGIPAHLFNLAFVFPYQVRDALIIQGSLPYEPDVIVYAVTLAEFIHLAPMPFQAHNQFFRANRGLLATLIADPPPGLAEPLRRYSGILTRSSEVPPPADRLREAGTLIRLGAHAHAESLVARVHSPRPRFQPRLTGRQTQYDCADTQRKIAKDYRDWKQWNILAFLERLHQTRGIEVLVVGWPIAHEPVGDCYSVRYTDAAVTDFTQWLAAEAAARGLHYLDLHDLLTPEQFFDSLHVNAEGHRVIGEHVARVLDPILLQRKGRGVAPRDTGAEIARGRPSGAPGIESGPVSVFRW